MRISEALSYAHDCFFERLPGDPDSGIEPVDAQVLLAFVLGKTRTYLMAFPEVSLSQVQESDYIQLIDRRLKGEPVAYLTGSREFWSMELLTNSSTLIPRPDTECLVELVLNKLGHLENLELVDLGTGSGAIALALAKEKPTWTISGIDLSSDAINLARQNGKKHQLSVNFIQGNWLQRYNGPQFDIIVSNPPYIDSLDPHLKQGDVRFEPVSALVAEQQGFSDFNNIVLEAKRCLKPGGWLFLEHGYQQQEQLLVMLEQQGFFQISGSKDYSGQDRNVCAQLV